MTQEPLPAPETATEPQQGPIIDSRTHESPYAPSCDKPRAHVIRHRDGGTVTVSEYLPRKAIRAFCTECMGFGDSDPRRECIDPLCPLYPYRGKLNAALGAKNRTAEV